MPRVVRFELPADDPQREVALYEKVFGWTITNWEGPFDYWLVTTGSDDELGINGAAMEPKQVTTDTFGVESVGNSLKKIVEAGGAVTQPKKAVPGIGYVAYCTDTEEPVWCHTARHVYEIVAVNKANAKEGAAVELGREQNNRKTADLTCS